MVARPALLAAILLAAGCKSARRPTPDEPKPLPQAPEQPVAPRDATPPSKPPAPRPAGAIPLVPSLSPIADETDPLQPNAWAGDAFVAMELGPTGMRLMVWTDLAKPPFPLAQVTGTITRIVASPRQGQIALVVFRPTDHPAPSPDDPADILIASTDRHGVRPLFDASDDFTVRTTSQVIWSPDGASLTVDGEGPGQPPRPKQTRVYDAGTGQLIASRPTAAKPDATTLRAPDGRHTVAFRDASIQIDGRRRFDAKSEAERTAVAALREHPERAAWLGGRALVLQSDAPMALDLATGKLRYIFPEGDFELMSASDDGSRVVARDRDQRLLWGRVGR